MHACTVTRMQTKITCAHTLERGFLFLFQQKNNCHLTAFNSAQTKHTQGYLKGDGRQIMAYPQRRVKYIIKRSASYFSAKSCSQAWKPTYWLMFFKHLTGSTIIKKKRCTCFIRALSSSILFTGCWKTLSLEHPPTPPNQERQRQNSREARGASQ